MICGLKVSQLKTPTVEQVEIQRNRAKRSVHDNDYGDRSNNNNNEKKLIDSLLYYCGRTS